MAKRFAGAIATFADGPSVSPSLLAKGYPWSSVGNGTGTIVDVGGSKGNISVTLAQTMPSLRFIVQDLPGAMQGAKEAIPSEIASRIEFMEHDFFKDQSVKADAFLFRMIFHNWSDEYVIKILKATVSGLKPGSRIIVNDYLVPEPKTMTLLKERTIRFAFSILSSESNFLTTYQGDGHDYAQPVQFPGSRGGRVGNALWSGRCTLHKRQGLGTKWRCFGYN